MTVCWENFEHSHELQKQAHDKDVKLISYPPGNNVWLNSKYIKTKQEQKLKAKFFGLFGILYSIGKHDHKFELLKK